MKIALKILPIILVALVILVSCSGDEPKATDQKEKPAPATEQVLVDSKINLLEEGRTTAVIDAKYIEKRFGDKNTMAKGITAYFYDSTGNITSWLVADSAEVNERDNQLEVFGNVEVTSADSVKLYTESLSWDQSTNNVVTDDYVEIHRQDNMVVRGYGLVTDRTLKEYTIKRQVSGKIKELPGKKDKTE
jgi:LPS export ABC transporter protein LptC